MGNIVCIGCTVQWSSRPTAKQVAVNKMGRSAAHLPAWQQLKRSSTSESTRECKEGGPVLQQSLLRWLGPSLALLAIACPDGLKAPLPWMMVTVKPVE